MKPLAVEDRQALRAEEGTQNEWPEYAEGPKKKPKFDCCVFKTRIPHYMWTTYTLPGCECDFCGNRWRSCHRVGNFTVILETRDVQEAELLLVCGPHWPFAFVFTSGFIILFTGASTYIFWGVLPPWSCYALAVCALISLCLLVSLGCSNPGVARRLKEKPPFTTSRWIYNDQASTWRSTADSYSQEMNVVLHDVDHICPFTGTAIAQRNMRRFIAFQLSLIFLGLALCAFVAAGVAVSALPQGTEG
jgi:hypothetical protein